MISDPDCLTVRTLAGLTLRLRHHHDAACPDNVAASLDLPLKRAERERHALFGQRVAFLSGGRRTGVYIEPRDPLDPNIGPELWIGGATVEIDDATATTVQAWLDSRVPYATDAPLPDTLPRDIAAPAAPGALA